MLNVDSQFVVDNEKQGDPLAGLFLMMTQMGRVRILSTLSLEVYSQRPGRFLELSLRFFQAWSELIKCSIFFCLKATLFVFQRRKQDAGFFSTQGFKNLKRKFSLLAF